MYDLIVAFLSCRIIVYVGLEMNGHRHVKSCFNDVMFFKNFYGNAERQISSLIFATCVHANLMLVFIQIGIS